MKKRFLSTVLLSSLLAFPFVIQGHAEAKTMEQTSLQVTGPKFEQTNLPGVTYVKPPQNFNPLTASDEELSQYHFPIRPKDSAKLLKWTNAMKHFKEFVVPNFTELPGKSSSIGSYNSDNWGGYEVVSPSNSFSQIDSYFNVPSVSQSTKESYSCSWVGIGGDGSTTGLIQAGTESDYYSGSGHYYAWYEQIPRGSDSTQARINTLSVHPGDTMWVDIIYYSSTGKADYYVSDETTGQMTSFTTTASGDYSGNTADFITERTEENGQYAPFAHINYSNFNTAEATDKGTSRSIGGWSSNSYRVKNVTMYQNNTTPLSSNSGLSTYQTSGDTFTLSWKAYGDWETP